MPNPRETEDENVTTPKLLIRVKTEGEFIKVYFNDLLHLAIIRKDILSFQSWKQCILFNLCLGKKKYCIEFISKNGIVLLCEYDNKETWVTLLRLLNDFI